jgi:hypothetical protein
MLKPATPFLSKDTLFNHFYELPMKLRAYVPVVAEISALTQLCWLAAARSDLGTAVGMPAKERRFLDSTHHGGNLPV